jgi:hypothetical protein
MPRAAKSTQAKRRANDNQRSKSKHLRRGDVVAVNPALLTPDHSYGSPEFVQRGYYVDAPFTCKDCGYDDTWTASQQKWWYEQAKGGVWTTARRCRGCRRKERDRINAVRRAHVEGLAKKALAPKPDRTVIDAKARYKSAARAKRMKNQR